MKDAGDGFEFVEYPPPNRFLSLANLSSDKDVTYHFSPMTEIEFKSYFDTDGRIIQQNRFRERLFKGGVDPSIRKDVWKFLFGYFSCSSTERERKILSRELNSKYAALKHRWRAQYSSLIYESDTSASATSSTTSSATSSTISLTDISSVDAEEQYMMIQAQLFAGKQNFDVKKSRENVRMIDKDVPRTDRTHPFYKDDDGSNQNTLREILITFAAYHCDIGYVQGMNDIASRFLIVLESEAEAFWCFSYYMLRFTEDFMEDGMLQRLGVLRNLLCEIDKDLYSYLEEYKLQDLTFCHRWLLLNFLREFNFEDGLYLFEVICCEHLEMNSLEAEKTRELSRQASFREEDGRMPEIHTPIDTHLTFNMFVCVAVLMENRKDLFLCTESTSVIQCMTSMPQKMTIHQVISQAEKVFYTYCRRSVHESFQILDISEGIGAIKTD